MSERKAAESGGGSAGKDAELGEGEGFLEREFRKEKVDLPRVELVRWRHSLRQLADFHGLPAAEIVTRIFSLEWPHSRRCCSVRPR